MTAALHALALQETLDEIMFQLAELKRQKANMLRSGTVKSFDADTNRAVLDVGYDTHDVDLGSHVGHWNPLVAGQQVMLLCPDGDASNAMVITGGFLGADKKPSNRSDEQALVPPGAPTDDSAVRIRKGLLRLEVKSLDKLKIMIAGSDQAFTIKPDALMPTDKD